MLATNRAAAITAPVRVVLPKGCFMTIFLLCRLLLSSVLDRFQRTLLVVIVHGRRFLGRFLAECGLDLSSLAAFVSPRLALWPSTIVDDGVQGGTRCPLRSARVL